MRVVKAIAVAIIIDMAGIYTQKRCWSLLIVLGWNSINLWGAGIQTDGWMDGWMDG